MGTSGIDEQLQELNAGAAVGADELPELDREAAELASRALEEMARGDRGAAAAAGEPAARDDGPAVELGAGDGALSFEELREMVAMLPRRIGGGELSDKESRFLGKVWARVIARRLTGPNVDLVLALVATVELFGKRAIAARLTAPAPVPQGDDAEG